MQNEPISHSEIHEQIESIRKQWGSRLLILGHHYQGDELLIHTDLQGDSFQLSAAAAENTDCETIVFCGVHFMAETADILANSPNNIQIRKGRRVSVLLPDLKAGCSMADMATLQEVELCWEQLSKQINVEEIVPVTYVNSTAELKAFCGKHQGFACTSTNAQAVLQRALNETSRVLFFPDQHLGRNTALKMGIPESQILMRAQGELNFTPYSSQQLQESRILLWNGYCNVHQKFTVEHIANIRKTEPGIRVIVHPECAHEVVAAADEAGSTAFILNRITSSEPGTKWAVGTEGRFVERLAKECSDKTVLSLNPEPSYCETMGMIQLPKLLETLQSIGTENARFPIRVAEPIATDARLCLRRMLECQS